MMNSIGSGVDPLDGKYQTVVDRNGYIYISSDYGQTWKEVAQFEEVSSISNSASGKYQLFGDDGIGFYISSDYGNTWEYVSEYGGRGVAINRYTPEYL